MHLNILCDDCYQRINSLILFAFQFGELLRARVNQPFHIDHLSHMLLLDIRKILMFWELVHQILSV